MNNIERLDWDSKFFKIEVGRLLLKKDDVFDPIKFKEVAKENFDLIYVFAYEHLLSHTNIKSADLDLVDVMMTMSMPFDKDLFVDSKYVFRNDLSKDELNESYEIAENTSSVSRFFTEEKIGPEKTKLLYRKWVDNAMKKSFSDGMFLVKENNSVVGINLIKVDQKKKEGIVSLIGVNPNYKRLGLGKKLWEQAFGFFSNETEITKVKTSFSLNNTESFNFHLKIGLNKIEEIKYIYHYRKNDDSIQ